MEQFLENPVGISPPALTPRERALSVVCGGGSVTAAARAAGVSRTTVWRWSKSPDWQARAASVQHEAVAAVEQRLRLASVRAAGVLVELMGRKHPPRIRLAAARTILEHAHALPPPGPEDPEAVAAAQAREARALEQRRLLAGHPRRPPTPAEIEQALRDLGQAEESEDFDDEELPAVDLGKLTTEQLEAHYRYCVALAPELSDDPVAPCPALPGPLDSAGADAQPLSAKDLP